MYALLLSATFMQYRHLGLVSGSLPWTSSELCGFCWARLDAGKCCQMALFMALMCCRLRHQDPPAGGKCVLLLRVNCLSKRLFFFCFNLFCLKGEIKGGDEYTCLWTRPLPDLAKQQSKKNKNKKVMSVRAGQGHHRLTQNRESQRDHSRPRIFFRFSYFKGFGPGCVLTA